MTRRFLFEYNKKNVRKHQTVCLHLCSKHNKSIWGNGTFKNKQMKKWKATLSSNAEMFYVAFILIGKKLAREIDLICPLHWPARHATAI